MDKRRVRRIIHIDMDAFYASIEQRDYPALKGRPVAVGYPATGFPSRLSRLPVRDVVFAESYGASLVEQTSWSNPGHAGA